MVLACFALKPGMSARTISPSDMEVWYTAIRQVTRNVFLPRSVREISRGTMETPQLRGHPLEGSCGDLKDNNKET